MLRHYEHRSETVQHFSESEYESESESEEDQKLVKFGQHAFVQRSDAGQCGSAVQGGGSMASGRQENYFANLTDRYNRALALNGDANYPKEWENNGCTYTDHQVDYHANKYIGHAQDSASHTAFSQKKSMVPTSSRPSTPQTGKKEQAYAYYENNQVNNGSSKPSIPKNGNGEQGYAYYEIHHLDNAGSKPQLSTTKIGKEEKGYASYETNKASNGRAYYESRQFNNGGSKPSTFNRGNEERRYAHYESNHANDGSSKLKPSTPKKEKEDQYGYAYYESNKDNSERMRHLRNNKDLTIPPGSRSKPSKGVIKSVYYYEEREFDNHPHARNGANYKRASYIPPNSKQI